MQKLYLLCVFFQLFNLQTRRMLLLMHTFAILQLKNQLRLALPYIRIQGGSLIGSLCYPRDMIYKLQSNYWQLVQSLLAGNYFRG